MSRNWNPEFLSILQSQVEEYKDFLEPSDREKALRYWILHRIRTAILLHNVFPHGYTMHEFGSFATGHYLSYGDIDLTISAQSGNPSEEKQESQRLSETEVLEGLCDMLKRESWVSYSSINLILDARVPVLKFKCKKWMGGIAIDIVAGTWSGMKSSKLVQSWSSSFPYLKPLVLVFKEWLRCHSYDVVYQGGLGGFGLINLLLLVFITYPDIEPDQYPLAQYLIYFIQVIGKKLDTSKYAIAIGRGTLIRKELLHQSLIGSGAYPNALVIVDPSDEFNNVAKSSYRFSTLVLDLLDTFRVLEASHTRFSTMATLPNLDNILQITRQDVIETRNKSELAMWTIERVYLGLELDINRSSHLELLDAFLKPSRNDFYDDGRIIDLDSSSSEEDFDLSSYDSSSSLSWSDDSQDH